MVEEGFKRNLSGMSSDVASSVRTSVGQLSVFVRWSVFALAVGGIVGAAGFGFHSAVAWATATRTAHPALLYGLPLAGVLIVWLYRTCGLSADPGTNLVLKSVRENTGVKLRIAPLIVSSTVLTHLCGGSSGREGAALQLGASISCTLGSWLRLDEKDRHIMAMCGMAAGFSALFGTPLAASVFAMEVVSVGVMYYSAFFPCLLSALTARLVAAVLGAPAEAFAVTGVPSLSLAVVAQVTVLGISCAAVAVLFCLVFRLTHHAYEKWFSNAYLRVIAGGLLVIALTLLLGTREYNGAGMDIIARAFAGEARPEAFLLKILLTAVTLGAGYKGGDVVPAFFAGATFGCVFAPVLGLSASFGAGLGMVGVFCGVTNCPLTSILLAYELFGGAGLPLYALCCSVSYMLSGYSSLYSAQKILYSKLRAEYIAGNR